MDALVQQLVGIWVSPANATSTASSLAPSPTASTVPTSSSPQASELPTSLPGLLSLFLSLPGLRDWFKLLLLGSIFETFRRFSSIIWATIVDSMFITAQFKEDDCSYDWIMVWLAKQPGWSTFIVSFLHICFSGFPSRSSWLRLARDEFVIGI